VSAASKQSPAARSPTPDLWSATFERFLEAPDRCVAGLEVSRSGLKGWMNGAAVWKSPNGGTSYFRSHPVTIPLSSVTRVLKRFVPVWSYFHTSRVFVFRTFSSMSTGFPSASRSCSWV
jgi:hypothetical protein